MYDRLPVPIWRYAIGHLCFLGWMTMMSELDGKLFQFWHGILLISLFAGSFLSNSIRYKRWDKPTSNTVGQTSVPSR